MSVMVKRSVWEIARELAQAIEESPELLEYKRTEDAVLADDEAVALIHTYEASKRDVKRSKGQPQDVQIALVERFMAVEEQFNSHEVIQAHWNARTRLDSFLDRVNAVVTFPITGEEAPKVKGGCGSSGGSCGCG